MHRTTQFRLPRHSRLNEAESVERMFRNEMPSVAQRIYYRIVERKPYGFFTLLTIEFTTDNNVDDGPKVF